MKTEVKSRLEKLISFDVIRRLKILEIFQYTLLSLTLVIIVGFFLEKHIFTKTLDHVKQRGLLISRKEAFMRITLYVLLETFAILIGLFYLRKLILIIPSIGTILSKDFIPLTTFDHTFHIALVYLFLECLPSYREKIKMLIDYEF